MTQESIVLRHLQFHKKITSWDAIQSYRITRLASIVHNLREQGYDIESETKSINGKKFAVYSLLNATKPLNTTNEVLENMKRWEQERKEAEIGN